MADQIIKQLVFRIDRKEGQFCDAICLPEEEFDKLSDSDIEAIKEQRFSNWLKVISTPPEPVIVQADVQLQQVTDQITSLQAQIDELSVKKDSLQVIVDKDPEAKVDASTMQPVEMVDEQPIDEQPLPVEEILVKPVK